MLCHCTWQIISYHRKGVTWFRWALCLSWCTLWAHKGLFLANDNHNYDHFSSICPQALRARRQRKKSVRRITPCSTLRLTSCQKMDDMTSSFMLIVVAFRYHLDILYTRKVYEEVNVYNTHFALDWFAEGLKTLITFLALIRQMRICELFWHIWNKCILCPN